MTFFIGKAALAKIALTITLIGGGALDSISTRRALGAAPWVREANPIARAIGPRGAGLALPFVDTGAIVWGLWKFTPSDGKTHKLRNKFLRDFLYAGALADAQGHIRAGINNLAVARRERNRFNAACGLGWHPPTGWRCGQ